MIVKYSNLVYGRISLKKEKGGFFSEMLYLLKKILEIIK